LVKIKSIELENSLPVRIVVELTVEEAAQIAKWTGSLSPVTGMTGETSELYGALTGSVFNRFWDDGVDGYLRGETE
jgi:hypothetical protein